jgi:hypothetical protein
MLVRYPQRVVGCVTSFAGGLYDCIFFSCLDDLAVNAWSQRPASVVICPMSHDASSG